jgi:hypothetical protein
MGYISYWSMLMMIICWASINAIKENKETLLEGLKMCQNSNSWGQH